jgi:hypothetical protein
MRIERQGDPGVLILSAHHRRSGDLLGEHQLQEWLPVLGRFLAVWDHSQSRVQVWGKKDLIMVGFPLFVVRCQHINYGQIFPYSYAFFRNPKLPAFSVTDHFTLAVAASRRLCRHRVRRTIIYGMQKLAHGCLPVSVCGWTLFLS